jgi:hypothetical protein
MSRVFEEKGVFSPKLPLYFREVSRGDKGEVVQRAGSCYNGEKLRYYINTLI